MSAWRGTRTNIEMAEMEASMNVGARIETSPCLLCAATRRRVVATRGRGFTPLTTVVCEGCGLVSHDPLPDAAELAAFYATRYRVAYKGRWAPKPKHALRALDGAIARARRLLAWLRPGARVVDLGASSGEFVLAMREAGCDASGVEPNRGYAAFARATYGVVVDDGGLDDATFAPGSVDMACLNHVLEHMADPRATLRRIGAWLKPEGLMFVEVPNLAGMRKQARDAFHYAHVWNFTPETLHRLAWQEGFAPVCEGEATGTSVILQRRSAAMAAPAGADAALAERIFAQVARGQRPSAYLLSGAPFSRRWQRLRRNLREMLILRAAGDWPSFARARIAAARLELAYGTALAVAASRARQGPSHAAGARATLERAA
jgi:SAM-dependent methyltransferase